MAQGRIKWYNRKKGFGFIEDQGGPDIFLHFSQVQDSQAKSLNEGDIVQYESVPGEKGPKATKVIKKPTCLSE